MGNKITNIKERIRQVAENKGVSYAYLYEILEMTDGSFKGNALNRPINSNAIVKLITEYPDVDLHWLITGKHKNEEKTTNLVSEPDINYEKKEDAITQAVRKIVKQESESLSKQITDLQVKLNALLIVQEIDEEIIESKISALQNLLKQRT